MKTLAINLMAKKGIVIIDDVILRKKSKKKWKNIVNIPLHMKVTFFGTDYIHAEPLNHYFRVYSDKIGL